MMPEVQPTNNPVPSDHPADARDNFKRIDEVVNLQANQTNPTRTGKRLNTIRGLESSYLQTPLNGGVWAEDIEFTAYNQYMVFNGVAYKPRITTTLPYTTEATPNSSFVVPFSELSPSNLGDYTDLVFDSVSDMISHTPHAQGNRYTTNGYYTPGDSGGGSYIVTNESPDGFVNLDLGGGLTASLDTSSGINTRQAGVLDGTDASDALEAFNNFVSRNSSVTPISYLGDVQISRKFLIGNPDAVAPVERTAHFDLTIDATGWTSMEEAVRFDGFTLVTASGRLRVDCGSSTVRNHLDGIVVGTAERSTLPEMNADGVMRDAIRYLTDTKTSLSTSIFNKVTFAGYRIQTTATGFTNVGSPNNVNQYTTLNIAEEPDYYEVGDFMKIGDYPYRIQAINGPGSINVYPWVADATEGMDVTVITGSGVRVSGGDSSLISINKIDAINVGVGLRNDALYPPEVGTLHCNSVGVGVTIGRDRNAALGGVITNFYMEGTANRDFEIVETSQSITGFSIISCSGGVVGEMYNIRANAGAWRPHVLQTKIHNLQNKAILNTGNNPSNADNSSSSKGVLFTVDSQPVFLRNTGSVNVLFDEATNRTTGLDKTEILLLGTGANGQPTGVTTINPPDGWTINGSASIVLSGQTSASRITFYFDIANTNIISFREELSLTT